MRCFTLTEANELVHGLLIAPSEAGHGVLFDGTVVRVERKIDDHLTEATAALVRRQEGDFNPSRLLGEDRRALIDSDTANDALLEVMDGWHVDHLTVDPETHQLMHIPYSQRERRCLLLVAPSVSTGGVVSYSSNMPMDEQAGPNGVYRTGYKPLESAAGVEQIFSDGRRTLLRLQKNASFRVYRQNCADGWREVVVSWNGRVLRKKPVGPRRKAA